MNKKKSVRAGTTSFPTRTNFLCVDMQINLANYLRYLSIILYELIILDYLYVLGFFSINRYIFVKRIARCHINFRLATTWQS